MFFLCVIGVSVNLTFDEAVSAIFSDQGPSKNFIQKSTLNCVRKISLKLLFFGGFKFRFICVFFVPADLDSETSVVHVRSPEQ